MNFFVKYSAYALVCISLTAHLHGSTNIPHENLKESLMKLWSECDLWAAISITHPLAYTHCKNKLAGYAAEITHLLATTKLSALTNEERTALIALAAKVKSAYEFVVQEHKLSADHAELFTTLNV